MHSPAPRALALFLGCFTLLNLAGEYLVPGFNANHWWINVRPLSGKLALLFLGLSGVLLVFLAFRPFPLGARRLLTFASLAGLLFLSGRDSFAFYALLSERTVTADFPVAFSLFIVGGLLLLLPLLRKDPPLDHIKKSRFRFLIVLALSGLVFPLAQIFCFGYTDYRRKADAVVVLGARVYSDGRLSPALYDRMNTAIELQKKGLAPLLIVSGGFDGRNNETDAMRDFAIRNGVPSSNVMRDPNGVNTRASAKHTIQIFKERNIRRVLVVSHFFHLPRIKMAYERRGWNVWTVPARQSRVLKQTPYLLVREVAALWLYYLRPLWGG